MEKKSIKMILEVLNVERSRKQDNDSVQSQ